MSQTYDNLPEVLQRIADCTDVGVALSLASVRGGVRITIPKNVEGSDLATIVGLDAAKKIAKELGHGQCMIPCGPVSGERGRREVAMRVLKNDGTAVQAALAADISERTVWRLKARLKDDETDSLPLFQNETQKPAQS